MAKQPMNKFLKFVLWAAGLFVGAFVLLLIAAAIIIPIVLPPAKLKALATDKFTTALHHKVSIGDVRFNVLSGFSIKNLVIANRVGWDSRPLVAAQDISISYHLFPLLWGQVSLGEIRLNNPDILVEHRNPNQFNFSDMTGDAQVQAAPAAAPKAASKSKAKTKSKKKRKHAALPVSNGNQDYASFFIDSAWAESAPPAKVDKSSKAPNVSVDSLNIIHGKLVYLDETVSPAQKSMASDLNLKVKNISLVGGKTTFTLDSPLSSSGLNCKLDISASLRFFLSGMAIKGLDLTGDVSGNGFKFSGDASDLSTNFTPNMDGEASLDILKFLGLVPHSLSAMPQGLSLDGPAKVDFHLGGSLNNGLELSGTADGTGLAIKYKDLFVKTNKTTCTIDFKAVKKRGVYDVPSFKVVYADWDVTGAFHYTGTSWSCQVHSKSLPFKGLPGMLPKMKNTTVDGDGSMDLSFVSTKGKTLPFLVNGQIALKNVGITLPQEPYLESMNGNINCVNNVVKVPGITFKAFDGTGAMGVTFNGNTYAYSYGFRLSNVNAQKAVDASIDAYVTTKDYTKYKDMLYGTMNFAYAGSGKGFSGDPMVASQVGSGSYNLVNAKVKGLAAIKAINSIAKDNSDEINFEKIDGTLSVKNKVFSYTANTTGKVGAFRLAGGINSDGIYTPDMKIQCDIRKDYINSDAIQSQVPGEVRGFVKDHEDYLTDDNGNIPVDVKFTGLASDNHYSYDWDRLVNNGKKHLGSAVQNAAQPVIQNLGSQLKGLFH